ncbi:MAG: NINE protein [Bacteriovoracaceae bacterium]
MENQKNESHSTLMGYILWIFGFMGAHRFYYGRPITGTIWFLTFGCFFIGWIIDFFLIPTMDREADLKFEVGDYDYNIAWILITFGGIVGLHRFYQRKWISGLIYVFTFGVFGIGLLYDFWNLNEQISYLNSTAKKKGP